MWYNLIRYIQYILRQYASLQVYTVTILPSVRDMFMMQKRVMCDLLEPSQLQLKQWGKAKAKGNVVYVTNPCFWAMMSKVVRFSLFNLY